MLMYIPGYLKKKIQESNWLKLDLHTCSKQNEQVWRSRFNYIVHKSPSGNNNTSKTQNEHFDREKQDNTQIT